MLDLEKNVERIVSRFSVRGSFRFAHSLRPRASRSVHVQKCTAYLDYEYCESFRLPVPKLADMHMRMDLE